jgi:hypothetical protein
MFRTITNTRTSQVRLSQNLPTIPRTVWRPLIPLQPRPPKRLAVYWIEILSTIAESSIAHDIATGVIALLALLWTRRRRYGSSERRYRQELRDQLKMMPFIYADLKGDILSDYVELDIYVLGRESRFVATDQHKNLTNTERTTLYRRIVFLGDAGMGKTTYQRYAIRYSP